MNQKQTQSAANGAPQDKRGGSGAKPYDYEQDDSTSTAAGASTKATTSSKRREDAD